MPQSFVCYENIAWPIGAHFKTHCHKTFQDSTLRMSMSWPPEKGVIRRQKSKKSTCERLLLVTMFNPCLMETVCWLRVVTAVKRKVLVIRRGFLSYKST